MASFRGSPASTLLLLLQSLGRRALSGHTPLCVVVWHPTEAHCSNNLSAHVSTPGGAKRASRPLQGRPHPLPHKYRTSAWNRVAAHVSRRSGLKKHVNPSRAIVPTAQMPPHGQVVMLRRDDSIVLLVSGCRGIQDEGSWSSQIARSNLPGRFCDLERRGGKHPSVGHPLYSSAASAAANCAVCMLSRKGGTLVCSSGCRLSP